MEVTFVTSFGFESNGLYIDGGYQGAGISRGFNIFWEKIE